MLKFKFVLDFNNRNLEERLLDDPKFIGKCGIVYWRGNETLSLVARQCTKDYQTTLCDKCGTEMLGMWFMPKPNNHHQYKSSTCKCYWSWLRGRELAILEEACLVKKLTTWADCRIAIPFVTLIKIEDYVTSLFTQHPPIDPNDVGFYCHRCFKTDFELVKCNCDAFKLRLIIIRFLLDEVGQLPIELRLSVYQLILFWEKPS